MDINMAILIVVGGLISLFNGIIMGYILYLAHEYRGDMFYLQTQLKSIEEKDSKVVIYVGGKGIEYIKRNEGR